jgi:hypothetical protein
LHEHSEDVGRPAGALRAGEAPFCDADAARARGEGAERREDEGGGGEVPEAVCEDGDVVARRGGVCAEERERFGLDPGNA